MHPTAAIPARGGLDLGLSEVRFTLAPVATREAQHLVDDVLLAAQVLSDGVSTLVTSTEARPLGCTQSTPIVPPAGIGTCQSKWIRSLLPTSTVPG